MAPWVMGFVMSRMTYDAPTTSSFSNLYIGSMGSHMYPSFCGSVSGMIVDLRELGSGHSVLELSPESMRTLLRVILRRCSGVCNSARSLTRCWNWRKGNDRLHGVSLAGVDLFSYVVSLDMRHGSR